MENNEKLSSENFTEGNILLKESTQMNRLQSKTKKLYILGVPRA